MKRRIVAVLLALAMTGSGSAFASAPESESVESGKSYLTSGDIYDAVMRVNPLFTVYYDDEGYLTIEQDPSTIPENGAWGFIQDTIMVLQQSELSGQKKIKFIAGHDLKSQDVYEIFGMEDYNGPDDFGIIHASLTTNESLKADYELAFQDYYGAHAVENRNKYYLHMLDPESNPAPSYYDNSYYWILSSFGKKATGTVMPDQSTIQVVIPGYRNDDVGGAAACLMAFKGLSRYGKIKIASPEIVPNDKIKIICTAENDSSTTVFNLEAHWNGASMYTDSITGSPNALTGIQSAIDVISGKDS